MELSSAGVIVIVGILIANLGAIVGTFVSLMIKHYVLSEKVGNLREKMDKNQETIEKDLNNLAKMIKQRSEV